MRMRTMGRSGLSTSVLSIGGMRLPKGDDDAVALLRAAIDAGCNYIDTSRRYDESELKIGKALKGGYREKVILSTKCSPWIFKEENYTESADHTRAKIEESMRRLDVDRLDFYQIWNIHNREHWEMARKPGGVFAGIHKAMDEGLVSHTGVTTHAPVDLIREMIDSDLLETVTVSYHLLSRNMGEIIDYAASKNVGVVVMNPLGGGALACESAVIRGFLPDAGLSSKEIALKFVLDNPSVTCAISGISKLSDVAENVATEGRDALSAEDLRDVAQCAADLVGGAGKICTQCGYCMPCPQDVWISRILGMANQARLFGLGDYARRSYANLKPERRVERCNQCGACRKKCTNRLDVPEELRKAHEYLTAQG